MFYNQELTPVLQFSTNLATPPLLRWRNVEMLMTDLLAQHVTPKEYLKEDREEL